MIESTLIDRAISYFAPVHGARRMRARAGMAMARAFFGSGQYEGARSDKNSLKNWNPLAQSADDDAIGDLSDLRSRSRDLFRNVPIANGAGRTIVTSVVGPVLAVNPQVDRDVLGLSLDEARAWEKKAARFYRYAARDCGLDYAGQMSIAEQQEITLYSELYSGDIVIVRRYDKRPGNLLGLKLQFIEADRVATPPEKLSDPNVVEGVEMDAAGVPIAYHVRNFYGDGLRGGLAFNGRLPEWVRVPARTSTGQRQVLHCFEKLRAGQTRGIPLFAPVIEPLKQLGRYTDSELMAAVVSSFFTVAITTEGGEGLAGATMDPTATGGDVVVAPTVAQKNSYELGPAAILGLMPGEKAEAINPMRPNEAFDPFVMAVLRQVGVALELPFELVIKHFTASYSASRAALMEAWRAFRRRRARLVDCFCQPSYEWAIEEAVALGHLAAPGFFESPIVRAAWLGARWRGPSMGQLNPLQEVEAHERLVDLGASTYHDASAELTGSDYDENVDHLQAEIATRREMGLPLPGSSRGIGMMAQQQLPPPNPDLPEVS